jgi:succinate dehydrogenase / fumarate reductase cytochrome b subunit
LFLLEHFISNSEALNGIAAYNAQVKFLTGLPFRLGMEIFGIFIPLAFHALYGIYIWWRGENNVIDYPWTGNWAYTLQRYSGIVVFAYVTYHIWYMRFAGVHLVDHYQASFWKVQNELMHPLALGVYVVGVIAASWHFGYGLFLFAAKWGIVTGAKAQKRMQAVGIAVSALLIVMGLFTIYGFVAKFPVQQRDPAWDQPTETPEQSHVIPQSIPSSQAR